MNIQEEAYLMSLRGMSYKAIGKQLGIGKTTAYTYVQEKIRQTKAERNNVGYDTKPSTILETIQREDIVSEQMDNDVGNDTFISLPAQVTPKLKEFTGDQLLNKHFDCLEFNGKFLELIGKPSRIFSGIIWGLPKGGKSNFALRFADYLQEYFGEVVYIAAEEGESVTLQEKFRDIGGSKVTVVESRSRQDIREYLKHKEFGFVFIDSINNAGIDNDYLEIIKHENSKKSFIAIVQATKGGNFKGDQALTHNCDFIIKVVDGVAYHSGRFNTSTEIKIFESPLYQKNPTPKLEKPLEGIPKTPKPKKMEVPFDLQGVDEDYLPSELRDFIEVFEQPPTAPLPEQPLKSEITGIPDWNNPIKAIDKIDLEQLQNIMNDSKSKVKLTKIPFTGIPSKLNIPVNYKKQQGFTMSLGDKVILAVIGIVIIKGLVDSAAKDKTKKQNNKGKNNKLT